MAAPTIVDEDERSRAAGGGHHLLVLSAEGASRRRLPAAGELSIGRDEEADVRLLDPRASRNHARLVVHGGGVTIEDLGSANGTRLREQRLEPGKPAGLAAGDAVTIGGTVLLLQSGEAEDDLVRIWAHGYLETRLVEECARAQSGGSELALAHVRVHGARDAAAVEEILRGALNGGDLVARYAPAEYEVLLLDCRAAAASARVQKVVAALTAAKVTAIAGLALYPADGTSPQALLARASEDLRARLGGGVVSPGVVVQSPAMRALYDVARRAAAGDSSVLIGGESGSGKEILAETIHRASPRAGKPFLPINCAAFSETLVESELFGYERGAFTGAAQAKAGLLEAATGGTLFLDEIGEMSLAVQAKLLRVIEAREVLRVGATKARPIDVRFIAATNRDLEEEVAEKRFRQDLFFRLNVIGLEIPPLRERTGEIEALARMFLDKLAAAQGRPAPRLSEAALACLVGYAWPGNIRELRNIVERAFVLCAGPTITEEHLPLDRLQRRPRSAAAATAPPLAEGAARDLKTIERDAIVDALQRCLGNQTRAAELLGMPRRTFCKRMKEYDIPRPRA